MLCYVSPIDGLILYLLLSESASVPENVSALLHCRRIDRRKEQWETKLHASTEYLRVYRGIYACIFDICRFPVRARLSIETSRTSRKQVSRHGKRTCTGQMTPVLHDISHKSPCDRPSRLDTCVTTSAPPTSYAQAGIDGAPDHGVMSIDQVFASNVQWNCRRTLSADQFCRGLDRSSRNIMQSSFTKDTMRRHV